MVKLSSSVVCRLFIHIATIRPLQSIAAAVHARSLSSVTTSSSRTAAAAATSTAPTSFSLAFASPDVTALTTGISPARDIVRCNSGCTFASPSVVDTHVRSMGATDAATAARRRSPRLNHALLGSGSTSTSMMTTRSSRNSLLRCSSTTSSSSTSRSSSTESSELDTTAAKKRSKKPRATSSSSSGGRRTRGRPRKSEDVSASVDGNASDTTGSSGGANYKRRKSSRVRKDTTTCTAIDTKTTSKKKSVKDINTPSDESEPVALCLPRTRELSLKSELNDESLVVIGVDEAGRGPLAGPVCAAAAFLPVDIAGITDSKKITKEDDREKLYEEIMMAPGVRWAVAIVDAQRIDEINILQATMEAMRMATTAVVSPSSGDEIASEVSTDRRGCYVIRGANDDEGVAIDAASVAAASTASSDPATSNYALIDGNRVPTDMPCDAAPLVKGDSREFCIGAASIIAKVTRDRLMHAYDAMYPEYNLAQHKGYPTAAHMAAVRTHGASPIHRRTFAPLKHMSFDNEGRIVED
mmetsp:Transcript_21803/g.47606  ORF Transcript_21803/g.47606 Transcript_21803/m.47606 type:complete len:526 (+) Transcript_21803:3-1580(+)